MDRCTLRALLALMPPLELVSTVFGAIFLAELPDKTALAALVLATRHRPAPVFLGASAALAVQSLVAVLAGSLFGLLPSRIVHVAAGLVFVVSAVLMWVRGPEADEATPEEEGPSARSSPTPAGARSSPTPVGARSSPTPAGARSSPTSAASDARSSRTPAGSSARPSQVSFSRSFTTVFAVIFAAEWGDLTQLATAAFAARERAPILVFTSSTLALWAVTAIAVGIGNRAAQLVRPHVVQRVAAVLFLTIGVALLVGAF